MRSLDIRCKDCRHRFTLNIVEDGEAAKCPKCGDHIAVTIPKETETVQESQPRRGTKKNLAKQEQ